MTNVTSINLLQTGDTHENSELKMFGGFRDFKQIVSLLKYQIESRLPTDTHTKSKFKMS